MAGRHVLSRGQRQRSTGIDVEERSTHACLSVCSYPPHRAYGILPCVVSDESTAPVLVELTRQVIDAGNRRDLDAVMSLYAPDVVWESLDGLGVFDGVTAVRGFLGGAQFL